MDTKEMYGTPHVISLCGNMLVFNTKRVSGRNDSGKSELTFSRLSFAREQSAFTEAARGAALVGRRTSVQVDIVTCKCVVDVQERVTAPCVLVAQRCETPESLLYTLLTLSGSSDRLRHRVEFTLPYLISGRVCVLQGPTVVWTHADNVFYTCVQTGQVRQIPAQLTHCVVGELPVRDGQAFVLGVHHEQEQSQGQSLCYFPQSGQSFDGSVIMPQPYIPITRCILVLSAHAVDGGLKSAVVAATSNQQLVHFHHGVVQDVCPLPFEQPKDIQLVNTGRNGCLFVISFHLGHVCAVWKETFQVASVWSGVSSVHVDDFLRCGTDQIVLVFDDEGVTGKPLGNVLITDLCGISYSHDRDTGAPNQPSPPPESNLLTIHALASRLQSGLTMLQELNREVMVKERVVRQSVQALTDVVSHREPVLTQPEEEGLIVLWDSDDESKEEALGGKMQNMPSASLKPQIDKLWHRFAEDQIVVGVILTIDSSVPLASVSLSILTETDQSSTPAVIQTQSQVLWLSTPCPSSSSSLSSSSSSSSSSCTLPEPAAKRSRLHSASAPNDLNACRMAVTAVTRLTPLLNSGGVKCRVMLHYVQRRDAFSLAGNPTPVVLHCGQIALDIHDDFRTQLLKNPKLKSEEVKEDLLSLLTVLDRWVFHIDSPDQSLGDIDGWMQKRWGCERIDVSPQYLLFNSSGPSSLMLLRWRQMSPFQGELSVHSSQLRTLQFLDSLLGHLPVSCSVRPVKGTGGQGAALIFSLALEKEVLSLRDCVSLLLSGKEKTDPEGPGHDETPDPTCVEGLRRCREAWQREVERGGRRLSPLVDVGRYRKLTQTVRKVQLDGDLAALLEIQRTLPR